MLDLNAIATLLSSSCPDLRSVCTALTMDDLGQDSVQVASAYVVLGSERAQPNVLASMGTLQQIDVELAIVLALPNVGSQRIAHAPDTLALVRQQVRSALLGYSPGSNFRDISFAQGALAAMEAGVLWWTDVFSTSYMEAQA